MSNYLRFIVFFSSLVFLGYTANWWESGISKSLTAQNFNEIVGKDQVVVIEFYAQFCKFCKDMQPIWDRLAENYMGENPSRKDVIIAKLDGGLHGEISMRYGIQAYPAILIFKKGEIFPADRFNMPRTFDNFQSWTERFAGPETAPEEVKKKEVAESPERKKIEGSASVDEHIHEIYDRIDDLGRSLSTGRNKKEHNELKDLLNEMHQKIDTKMTSSSADINFKQGIGFLIFGGLIGVAISFTYINYQKLGRKRLAD